MSPRGKSFGVAPNQRAASAAVIRGLSPFANPTPLGVLVGSAARSVRHPAKFGAPATDLGREPPWRVPHLAQSRPRATWVFRTSGGKRNGTPLANFVASPASRPGPPCSGRSRGVPSPRSARPAWVPPSAGSETASAVARTRTCLARVATTYHPALAAQLPPRGSCRPWGVTRPSATGHEGRKPNRITPLSVGVNAPVRDRSRGPGRGHET